MEKHSKVLSEGLVRRGHSVTVITTRHPQGKKAEVINGVKYYYLENTVPEGYSRGWWRESARKFGELCRNDHFDILWSESWGARSCVGKLTGKYQTPTVAILQGTAIQGMQSRINSAHGLKDGLGALKWILGKQLPRYIFVDFPLVHRVDAIISASNRLTKDIQRHYRVSREKISTIYNGIDIERFKPDQRARLLVRQKYGIPSSEMVILVVGRVVKEKGMHLAIRMCAEIKGIFSNYKLLIAGQGPHLSELQKLATKSGLQQYVVFCGRIPNEEMSAYYNASDVFLLPTLHVEGLPFSLLEAMSCEKPVISSDIGGVSSAVKDGENGFMFPAGDIQVMLNRTLEMLSDYTVATRLARSARRTIVEHFSEDTMIDRTIEVFKHVRRTYAYSRVLR